MIISELLTNSIKHANDDFTLIELIANNDTFMIRRVDNGKPFNLKNHDQSEEILEWPLTGDPANTDQNTYRPFERGIRSYYFTL